MAKVSLGEFQENTKLSLAGDDRCEIRQGGQDCKDNLSRITRERSSQLEDSFGLTSAVGGGTNETSEVIFTGHLWRSVRIERKKQISF